MANNSTPNDPGQSHSSDLLDHFEHFNLHFGRYLRDVAGILLIALALMSLLALWGFTGGVLLTPWAGFLSKWLGWGSYLIILAFGYGGFSLFQRGGGKMGLFRILALELASLLTLSLLAVLGGDSLVRAEAGMDGGRLGWSITYLLDKSIGSIWSVLVLLVLWLLTVATGLGLWAVIEAWLSKLAGEPVMPPPLTVQPEAVDEPPKEGQPAKSVSKK